MLGWLQLFALGGGSSVAVNDGLDPTNLTAEVQAFSGNEICDRSGRKVFPGELVQDPYSKQWVLPKYQDIQQREMRYRSVQRPTSRFSETEDAFVGTITADDL